MSVRSRLRSHRAEASPSLFHSSLGSVDPLSVRLEIGDVPAPGDGYERYMDTLSALLHERHHWLQHVGTSAGLFGSILLEMQGGLILGSVPLGDLWVDDLPLLESEQKFSEALRTWEHLEATRRLFFGCRLGDFKALIDTGRTPLFQSLLPFVEEMVEGVYGPSPHLSEQVDHLRSLAGSLEKFKGPLLKQSGWTVGARHLMEGAARQAEIFRRLDLEHRRHVEESVDGGPLVINVDEYYAGIYGVARKIFNLAVETVSTAAEVGFAFACDLALNVPCPPVTPFPVDNPGVFYFKICHALRDFRFDRSFDLYDPAQVRSLLEELADHVGNLSVVAEVKRRTFTSYFGHLDPEELAGNLFEVSKGNLPRPMGGARLKYVTALGVLAERVRADVPDMFVFPVASYCDDRGAFRKQFNRIQPPLVSYGTNGIAPTRDVFGWLEYFLALAVQNEVGRSLVMFDVGGVAARLAPLVRSIGGEEHGRAVVRRSLAETFGGAPLAEEIWKRVETCLAAGHAAE